MMKITHFCLAGTISDGWSYQENLLAKYHQQLGHQVTIITSRWVYNNNYRLFKAEHTDYYLKDNTHVIRLEMRWGSRPNGRFARFKGIREALETAMPDILFIHGCQFLDMKKVIAYCKEHNNMKVYVDNHADFSNSATNFASRLLHISLWRHMAHLIEPFTAKFYGVLPARCEFLTEIYRVPKNKVELLVMGADDDLVKKAEENRKRTLEKYSITDDDFLIVTGGKIDKFKTQTLLLMEAINNINNPNLKIIVFGSVENSLTGKINSLADGKRIKYIGWLAAEDSYDLFATANLVVFPGRHSVYWEQVAGMGIPMIVKDWPGTHHIDQGGNIEYLYLDKEIEIREKIQNIISDKSKYTSMLTAAQECKKNFSYKEIAQKSIE